MTNRQPCSFQLQYEPTSPLILPASTYNVPLHVEHDYARISAYLDVATRPTLLDHAQYFSFLADLADRIWLALGNEARIFVEVRAPYIDSLPATLLRNGLLMGSQLLAEAEFWAEHGKNPVVWIADQIRRDLDYPGDNSIRIMSWPEEFSAQVGTAVVGCWATHAVRLEPMQK